MPSSHARRTVRIGDIGKVVTGKTPKTSDPANFGFEVPFVTPTDFDGRKWIGRTIRSLSEKGAKAIESSRLPENAVLVTCIGSDMGKVALSKYSCATNQQINSLVVGTDDLPEYVYYNLFLRKAELRQMASGSAQPILNKSAFSAVELDLPSVSVQRYVVDVLSALDNRIDLLAEESFTLQNIAEVIFKSWFIDFDPVRAKSEGREPEGMSADIAALFPSEFVDSELGPIPKGWRITSVREAAEIFDSRRVPLSGKQRAEKRGDFPYYGAAALMDYVDDYLFDGVHLLLGEDGSVVDANGFPVTQYVWGRFWVNNHAHVLKGANGVCTEHLMLALKQVPITPYVTGAVQAKLSQGNLWRIPFLMPSESVLTAFSTVISPLYDGIRRNADTADTLQKLRDILLPRLLSGAISLPS